MFHSQVPSSWCPFFVQSAMKAQLFCQAQHLFDFVYNNPLAWLPTQLRRHFCDVLNGNIIKGVGFK